MKKEEHSKIKSDILLRVRLLYVLFILGGAVVLGRLIWVQAFSKEVAANATRLEKRIFKQDTIPAQRGNILARNGEPLALSLMRYQADFDFASPGLDSLQAFYEQSDSLSELLAAFFQDKTAAEYSRKFREEHSKRYRLVNGRDTTYLRSTGWLAHWIDKLRGEEFITRPIYDTLRDHTPVKIFPREVDYAEWQVLRKYPMLNWNMGMIYNLSTIDQRVYPQGELARRTIGLTGDQGNYGIEKVYKEALAGLPGLVLRQRIARGFYGRVVDDKNVDPVDGADLVTTLDLDLQDVADKILRQQLTAQSAIWGTTIVMEVTTGRVLALVNLGRNAQGEYVENVNYAIAKRAELGSVFKLATMITLLEDAKLPMTATYDTENGQKAMVGGAAVQDSHSGFGNMDFKTAVAQSSNVYFAKAVWDKYSGRKEYYSDCLRKLHLDRTVGLEAFGERPPLFPHNWKKLGGANQAFARLSFGYVIELTPIQMITLYNAVANNGRMVAPQLIREIHRKGVEPEVCEPKVLVEKICSDETLRKVHECLEEVAVRGTAARFFRDTTLFRAGAKTGTAQFSQDGLRYSDGYYMGSMVSYLPADKPRYTILTTIHTRRQGGKAYYGGPLAGPVVKQMAGYIYNREHDWHDPLANVARNRHPSQLKGGNIAQMRKIADKFSPHASYDTRTGWGRVRVDSLSNVIITSMADSMQTMPNVVGMGLKDALFLLECRELIVRFSGSGAICEQSIVPGTAISRGTPVQLTLN
ncbi:MAG: penicillin-binding transpeptidase domain-containing protein [Alistipes sp.]